MSVLKQLCDCRSLKEVCDRGCLTARIITSWNYDAPSKLSD